MAQRFVVMPDWLPRVLANVSLVALVVYFAVVLANVTWLIAWQDRPVGMSGSGSMGSVKNESRQPLSSYALFGEPPADQPVADVIRKQAPETNLRLRLEGVFVSKQPGLSGAIVAGTDGVAAYYRIGDTLPGNAELVDVDNAQVLLRRNGAFETLTFEEDESADLIMGQGSTPPPASLDDFVANAKARLESQGSGALVAFGLRPVQDGATQGYVYDGSNAMLRAMNLQKGDVITAINGEPLGDFRHDRELLDSWRSQAQLEVEIERDGARFTVSYALPQ